MFTRQLRTMVELTDSSREAREREAARNVADAFAEFAEGFETNLAAEFAYVHAWTIQRETLIRREALEDPYREAKARENQLALVALAGVLTAVRTSDDDGERLRLALAATLVGNRFDFGSPLIQAGGTSDLRARTEALAAESWLHDDSRPLAALIRAAAGRVVILVDNAGPDFVCGVIALALHFCAHGWLVRLAANETPSLNDVTAAEALTLLAQAAEIDQGLRDAIAAARVTVLSTGNGLPGIDLRDISRALASAANDSELVVFIGQGRAVETNWRARLAQPALRVATLKDPMVAATLGGELLSSVVELRAAGASAPARVDDTLRPR